jgi:hypothetical protein
VKSCRNGRFLLCRCGNQLAHPPIQHGRHS